MHSLLGHEEGSGRSAPSRLSLRTHDGKKRVLENHNERLRYLPSNAAATLLLRFCVASNALAVAAAEGGLLVLIIYLTFFKSRNQYMFAEDKSHRWYR